MEKIPTLFEWAGGNDKLEELTSVFYDKVLKDDLLAPAFRNMSPAHVKYVAHFIAEVFGGGPLYTGGDGGSHAKMVQQHIGKRFTEEMRRRWMHLMLEAADEIGIPTDPEFRSALIGYLEWGTRIAVMNSNTSENPVGDQEPMPKWGWGETGGPYVPPSNLPAGTLA
jgi:hemoglobin